MFHAVSRFGHSASLVAAILAVSRVGYGGEPLPSDQAASLPAGAVARLGTQRTQPQPIGFLPDGKSLIGVQGLSICEWETATGRVRRELTIKLYRAVGFVLALSPSGQFLAVRQGGDIRLWDVMADRSMPLEHEEKYDTRGPLAFSPDGKVLAGTQMGDRELALWDVASGKKQHKLALDGRGIALAFSPDGKRLAVAVGPARDIGPGKIAVFDVDTAEQVLAFDPGEALGRIAFSPDGKTIASAGTKVALWDAATGKQRGKVSEGGPSEERSVAFLPDGRLLLGFAGRQDRDRREIVAWDVAAGKTVQRLPCAGGTMAVAADGKTVAVAASTGPGMFWDLARGKPLFADGGGHGGTVHGVVFSRDGKSLLSIASDQTVRHWDTTNGKELHCWDRKSARGLTTMGFGRDGTSVLLAQRVEEDIVFTDPVAGKELCRAEGKFFSPQRPHSGELQFSANGKVLVSRADHRTDVKSDIAAWDTTTGKRLATAVALHAFPSSDGRLLIYTIKPDERQLATGVVVQDLKSGQRMLFIEEGRPRDTLTGHSQGAVCSPDGKYLLIPNADEVSIYNLASGERVHRVKGLGYRQGTMNVRRPALSPDGKHVATADADGTVLVWSAAIGAEVARFQGHQPYLTTLAFSADGSRLASAGVDSAVFVWDVARLGQLAAK